MGGEGRLSHEVPDRRDEGPSRRAEDAAGDVIRLGWPFGNLGRS